MLILASDFSGLAWIFVGIPIALSAVAAISFLPAIRGHWSCVALAAPTLVFGLLYASLLMFASARSGLMPGRMCALLLAPPVLGIFSLGVWSERRHEHR